MLYFCNYSKCHLRLKHIIGEFARSSADKLSESIESALQRHVLSTLTDHIGKCIEDVGTKIENLISNQSGLQEEFYSISRPLQDSSVSNVRITPSTAHTCTIIVEELAERDRRKRNIVMDNLPEARDREADKVSVLSLIKSVYSLESSISRVVHPGKRIKDKYMQAFTGICFENMPRLLYFPNLIYYIERNSLKWSL